MKRFAPALIAPMLVMTVAATAAAAGVRNVSPVEARRVMATKKHLFLLDVRTPEEYRQARLKGAVLIPMDEIGRRLREVPRHRPIMVYCAVGSRSGAVAGYLAGKGYREV